MASTGLIFILFGILYILKPDIFRRWFWKKTSVMQQTLSPEKYIRSMRILGVALLVVGIILLIVGKFRI